MFWNIPIPINKLGSIEATYKPTQDNIKTRLNIILYFYG